MDNYLDSSPTLTNCILWGNTAPSGSQIYNDGTSSATVMYNDVQGGWPGTGNIDVNPLFVAPAIGDYHLLPGSPCIDAGNPHSPIGLEPFPNGGRINMGAYGGTPEASKSYFDQPPCEIIVAGDINGDCKVNFKDFALMAFHWLEDYNTQPPPPL